MKCIVLIFVEEIMLLYRHQIWFVCTVKPPKRDRIGDWMFGLCRDWSYLRGFPSNLLYVTIIHHTITEHRNNHIIYNE